MAEVARPAIDNVEIEWSSKEAQRLNEQELLVASDMNCSELSLDSIRAWSISEGWEEFHFNCYRRAQRPMPIVHNSRSTNHQALGSGLPLRGVMGPNRT